MANFTEFLKSTENFLEWHKNLLKDQEGKKYIKDVIDLQIKELTKVL